MKKQSQHRSIGRYIDEIKVVPLISQEEEQRLARKIKNGDKAALNKLVEANLRFVVSVAKQYQNLGLELLDLINEGNIGLMTAAKRFDESRGFKFISYAVWWIRQAILKALAEQTHMVRMPVNKSINLRKSKKVRDQLEQDLGRQPNDDEVAAAMGLDHDNLAATIMSGQAYLSLDKPFSEDGEGSSLIELLEDKSVESPEFNYERAAVQKLIHSGLDSISDLEADILKLYFAIGHSRSYTLEEIGAMYQLTRERIRQIKEKAIRRLANNKQLQEIYYEGTTLLVVKPNSKKLDRQALMQQQAKPKLISDKKIKESLEKPQPITNVVNNPSAMIRLKEPAEIVLMATSYLVLVDRLPPEQIFSLIRYYGFSGDPPLTWQQVGEFEIKIIENKEQALASLSKLSGDSYEQLRNLFMAFRELKLAQYDKSAN